MFCVQKWKYSVSSIICGKYMPFTIRKLPGRRLYSVKSPTRVHAKATTLKRAQAQVRLLYMIERKTMGKRR
jgi:hypothetical protein